MALHSVDVAILPDGRMDRKNAAKYLGLAVKTLAMHASRGTGPTFINRGRVFYFRQDLDDWLKEAPSGRSPFRRASAVGGRAPAERSRNGRRRGS
jgi:hypothetical protein